MEEISLKSLLENYEHTLCNKLFIFTLENNAVLKIRFFKESMCHLLGLQHIYKDYRYLGNNGYNKIKREEITISHLKKHDKSQYNFIKNRILHFPEIIDILRGGDLVRFSTEKVKRQTYIKADFVLYKDKQEYRLHLFLIKEINTDIYTPTSFFPISDNDDKTNYIVNSRPIKIIQREEIVLS